MTSSPRSVGNTSETVDALDSATLTVTPTRPSAAALPPLPKVVIERYNSDNSAALLYDSSMANRGSPPGVPAKDQSETSEASQSEDEAASDDGDDRFLALPSRSGNDFDLASSLSSLRLHSRPPTPEPSAHTRLQRTPSNIWYQHRGKNDEEEEQEEDDTSETSEATFPESFAKSIRAVQRAQALLDRRTTELEKELATLRTEFVSSVDTSKALLMKTKESILKERRSIEKTNETAADGLLSLEQKLARAQVSIATLQAQHSAEKDAMESMANDIAEVLAIQEDMGCRLIRLSESQQGIYETAGHTRNLLKELPHGLASTPPSADEHIVTRRHPVNVPKLNLAAELATAVCFHSCVRSGMSSPDRVTLVSGDNTLCPSDNDELDPKDEFELPVVFNCVDNAHSRTLAVQVATGGPGMADQLNVDTLQPSLAAAVTAAASATDLVPPTRFFIAYSWLGVKLRMPAGVIQWMEDAKSKPEVKKLREAFTAISYLKLRQAFTTYAPGAPSLVTVILAMSVVVPTIMMCRRRAVGLPAPEPTHVSDHPIWDSL